MTSRKFQTLERLITLLPGLPDDIRTTLVGVLCEGGLQMISRTVEEAGSAEHPVDLAVALVDLALKTGHPEVLNEALKKVDVTWPTEVVMAFWAASAAAANQLPARDTLWERFEARALPRIW